jgi:glycosyltransferase involved in cell wall biosynthesis
LNEIGARGRAYADEHADWDKVIARYESLLDLEHDAKTQTRVEIAEATRNATDEAKFSAASLLSPAPRAVHQLLPDIVYGDAISNQARAIRDHLRRHGYESEIFVKRREARMASEARLFDEAQPAGDAALIYHHSIGSELTAFAVAHEGPKCLVYHNVTPAEFYAPYRPGFAWMLETGRAHLARLAPHFAVSVGDSAFNAAELAACGFRAPGVLPIIVDPDKWNIAPDENLMARLQDGRTNILFVGRVAPNKRQDRLVEAFAHYRRLAPHARLVIAGEGRTSDPYFQRVRAGVAQLDAAAHVEVTGQIADAALLAYYRTAHLYWSFSAHEGFGAPLVEAMWFDVPVLALRATAVPETLSAAGVLFNDDEDLTAVAAQAYQLTHDADARRTVIAAQRTRRLDFTPAAV